MIKYFEFTDNIGSGNFTDTFCQYSYRFQKKWGGGVTPPHPPLGTPLILGIIESKLDSSITNAEVNINGYSIIANDRNRNGGGVACYIRNDLCFDIENSFSNSLNMFFIRNSHSKS